MQHWDAVSFFGHYTLERHHYLTAIFAGTKFLWPRFAGARHLLTVTFALHLNLLHTPHLVTASPLTLPLQFLIVSS